MPKETIFLIEGDDHARPIFRNELKRLGYRVSLAVDEEDALERAERRALAADLMLIGLPKDTPAGVLEVARNIFRVGNLNAPIVVIATSYGSDLEGTDVKISESEYITYLHEPDQLPNLLLRLLSHF